MKLLPEQSPLNLALAILAGLGLLTLIAALVPSPSRWDDYETAGIPSPRLLFPEPLRQGTFGDFVAISDHPLFNADRQKDPPEPASQTSALPALEGYRLAGMIIAGDTSIAMVERRATHAIVTLRIGDNLDGRTVKEITAEGIVFTGSSVPETLAIPKASGVAFASKNTLKSGVAGAAPEVPGMGGRDAN